MELDQSTAVRTMMSFSRPAKWLVFSGCAYYTLSQYLGSPWILKDDSMEPSFRSGQVVFCSTWPW